MLTNSQIYVFLDKDMINIRPNHSEFGCYKMSSRCVNLSLGDIVLTSALKLLYDNYVYVSFWLLTHTVRLIIKPIGSQAL